MFHVLCLTFCLLGGDERPLDSIQLVKGKRTLEGYVVFENDEKLILQVGSKERELAQDEIANINSLPRRLARTLQELQEIEKRDLDGHLKLAHACQERELADVSHLLALAVLAQDSENEDAHLLLDHRKTGKHWSAKGSSRWLPFDKMAEKAADWGDAWEIETPHYSVRTNLPLADATDVALDLEHFYQAFYTYFGPELEVREVLERMPVHVHGDSVSFPESIGSRPAYFRASDFTVVVNAQGGVDREVLLHEATHQLLYMTAVRRKGARGQIPGWVGEGLAIFMAHGASGEPGRMKTSLGEPDARQFGVHRAAEKPFKLSRVLAMGASEFHESSDVELKYAQAYTLVHFLLQGAEEEYRPGFFDFLRGAYLGQSSSTHFKKTQEKSEKELEKAWHEYAQR